MNRETIDRLKVLAHDLSNEAFTLVDAEPGFSGEQAAAASNAVERAFLQALGAMERGEHGHFCPRCEIEFESDSCPGCHVLFAGDPCPRCKQEGYHADGCAGAGATSHGEAHYPGCGCIEAKV